MATSSAAAAAAAADPSWCTPGVAAAFTFALAALGRARRLRFGGDPEKNHVETRTNMWKRFFSSMGRRGESGMG